MEVANPGPRPEKPIEIYEFEGYGHHSEAARCWYLSVNHAEFRIRNRYVFD